MRASQLYFVSTLIGLLMAGVAPITFDTMLPSMMAADA